MKVMTTPWKDDFLSLVSNSKKSIKITSPYVSKRVCDELFFAKQSNTKLELITDFNVKSCRTKYLDISAIEKIIESNNTVKSYKRLHSKIYIFDDEKAIITSGNLTNGGLLNNYEYGIFVEERSFVLKVVDDFNLLSRNEKTGTIKKSHTIDMRGIILKLPKYKEEELPSFEIETQDQEIEILEIPNSAISSSLKGWKLEVFNCVSLIPKQVFNLNDLTSFENHLKQVYPSNQHITEKIRQQLQYLRDLGLIEFLGNGQYRKLWK